MVSINVIHERAALPAELPAGAKAKVHLIVVQVSDIKAAATEIITALNDVSWIAKLDPVARDSYEATALRTIDKLTSDFASINSSVTSSFGEYLVSIAAGDSLEIVLNHDVFPIAELWKEKVTKNHGFDFHTESLQEVISFGEAKYEKGTNPYNDSADQILKFIALKKDRGDGVHLEKFASKNAISNLLKSSRGFTVAFSMHSDKPESILKNALKSDLIKKLILCSHELHIVGVKS